MKNKAMKPPLETRVSIKSKKLGTGGRTPTLKLSKSLAGSLVKLKQLQHCFTDVQQILSCKHLVLNRRNMNENTFQIGKAN